MSLVEILAAVYGAEKGSQDATDAVQTLVDGGDTSFSVTNDNMGGDPDQGTVKSLAVMYRAGVANLTAAALENDTMDLLPAYTILGAVYGAEAGSEDVTSTVQELVTGGTTTITASNDNFGDPAFEHKKQFWVAYVDASGNFSTAVCAENDSVTL